MLRDSIIAAVRTGVAALVGVLLTWLLNVGVEIPDNFEESLNAVLVALITLGYNLGVGLLERRVNPYFGLLLGVPKAPAYGAVGSQTPPPVKPGMENDRGESSYLAVAAFLALVGLLVLLLTPLDVLGWISLVLALVALAAGLVTSGRSRGL